MPQQISWYQEGRIIYDRFEGVVTLNDVREANDSAIALIRAGTPPVHDIVDGLNISKPPFDIKALSAATTFFAEPNLGWVIYINRSPVLAFLGSLASKVYSGRFKVVHSLDEALATLHQLDPSLALYEVTRPAP
jgi:hypothetical protein